MSDESSAPTPKRESTYATAAVLRTADGRFSRERIVLPPIRDDQVLIAVTAAGLCHTDLLARVGVAPLPVVLGHEGSGVVEHVGYGVKGIQPGDHVVLSFDSCGTCDLCQQGSPSYCREFARRNTDAVAFGEGLPARDAEGAVVHHRWFGQSSFASHCIASSRNVVRVEKALPLELLGPLGCGIQTGAGAILNVLRPARGSRVGVVGAGAVGMAAVLAARVSDASDIVVIEPNAARRARALELGASHAVAPGPDTLTELRDTVGGLDCVLDTTGAHDAIRTAVSALDRLGTCGVVSWRDDQPVVGPIDLVMEGRTIVGICEGAAEPARFIPYMIELWQTGRFPFDQLVRTFPFEQIDDAEHAAVSGDVIKPVMVM